MEYIGTVMTSSLKTWLQKKYKNTQVNFMIAWQSKNNSFVRIDYWIQNECHLCVNY